MSGSKRFIDRGPQGWQRVSRDRTCPICGRPDWCGVSRDGIFAVCMRIEEGSVKPTANGGYLHRLASDLTNNTSHGRTGRPPGKAWRRSTEQEGNTPSPAIDWPAMQRKLSDAVRPDYLGSLAIELGVTTDSLSRLGIGWQRSPNAWAFPMVGPDTEICGIRLRSRSGNKWSVKGSRTGIFMPSDFTPDQGRMELLLIAEGPTDTAALLDLGFNVIGRPDCASKAKGIARFAARLTRDNVVVVADADEPGQRGAKTLLQQLWGCALSARSITPPDGVKDARAWVQAGATYEDVAERIIQAYQKNCRLPIRKLRGLR